MKIILLSLVIFVSSCSRFTESRPHIKGKNNGATAEPSKPSYPDKNPAEIPATMGGTKDESNNIATTPPLDSYLSIGSFLQKELEKTDNAGNTVKVYAQLRQENELSSNLNNLKKTLTAASTNLAQAVDDAKKRKVSSVEFDVEINALKSNLGSLAIPLSSIEMSASAIPLKD